MTLKRSATAVLVATGMALGFIVSIATAKDTPESIIKARKAQMKEVVLKGLKVMKQMVKDDFIDADEAAAHMNKIAAVAEGFARRFPKGTETGFETTAAPKIWQDFKGFEAGLKKLASDAKAAASVAKDDAAFKKAFVTVAKNCKKCHETYRIKKKK